MLDLNEVVLEALDLHSSYDLPTLDLPSEGKRIVIASGNALPTGRIIYADEDAIFANESQYLRVLEKYPDILNATVISASGGKHAPAAVRDMLQRGIKTTLLTCNRESQAAGLLPSEAVIVTRARVEPITYNTSTYLGMILAKTGEKPSTIKDHILSNVQSLIPDLSTYKAFFLLVHSKFEIEREMFVTKFDELFGGRLLGRCYTPEQTLHAKTVVPWEHELFISFGFENEYFGDDRLTIPLPPDANFGAMLSVGYYVIGRIQAQFPAWFKANAAAYELLQSQLFERFREPNLGQTGSRSFTEG